MLKLNAFLKEKNIKFFTQNVAYPYRSTSKNTIKIRIREMYIGNPEIHEIGSCTKLLFTFLSLRFFNMRRERHNFFRCWLSIWSHHVRHISYTQIDLASARSKNPLASSKCETQLQLTQTTRGARSAQSRLASPRSESQLTGFFFKPHKILSASGHDVIHVPGPFPIWGLYCDISDCKIRPARAWTPAFNVYT